MKKIILSLILVVFVNTILAQTGFEAFENKEGISAVIVNKKMFSLLSKMDAKDKESQQYVTLIRKLDDLKVFVTKSNKITEEMKLMSNQYLKSDSFEELMKLSEKGKTVNIYLKSGASATQIKELIMFIEGAGDQETVLMSLTGDFDLNELSILTDKMKLPGGDDLKKAAKNYKAVK